MYKHEMAQLSYLISRLLRSASRPLYCNEEVLSLSLILPVVGQKHIFSELQQLAGLVIDARRMRERERETESKIKHFKFSSTLSSPFPVVPSQLKMLLHLLFTRSAYSTTCNKNMHLK